LGEHAEAYLWTRSVPVLVLVRRDSFVLLVLVRRDPLYLNDLADVDPLHHGV